MAFFSSSCKCKNVKIDSMQVVIAATNLFGYALVLTINLKLIGSDGLRQIDSFLVRCFLCIYSLFLLVLIFFSNAFLCLSGFLFL